MTFSLFDNKSKKGRIMIIVVAFLLLVGPVGAQTPSVAPSPSASDIETLRKEIEKAAERVERNLRQRAEEDRLDREAVAEKLSQKTTEAARAQAKEVTAAMAKHMEDKKVEDQVAQDRIQAETRKWIYIIIAFLGCVLASVMLGFGIILRRDRRVETRPDDELVSDNQIPAASAAVAPPDGAQELKTLVDPEMPLLRQFWETHRTDGVQIIVTVFNYGRPGNNERVSGYVRFRFDEDKYPMIKFPGHDEVTWENRRKAAVKVLNAREKIPAA